MDISYVHSPSHYIIGMHLEVSLSVDRKAEQWILSSIK